MSKLEVEFELTGLKFKISGERDDVSGALANLQQQVASLVQSAASAAGVLNGKGIATPQNVTTQGAPQTLEAAPKGLSSGRGNKARRGSGSSKVSADAIEFRHNAEKYGFPKQDWNTANRAMWLLYILEMQTEHKEVTAGVLAATFKRHFKQFGDILKHNITRDLGLAKGKTGYVNSDSSHDPETWFLLADGKKAMEALIQNPTHEEASTMA